MVGLNIFFVFMILISIGKVGFENQLPDLKPEINPSFNGDILPLFESTCSIEDCHDGVQPPDLRTYQKIYKNKEDIVLRINDERYPMPPLDVPDIRYFEPGEKELIINWIQNGALEN